MGTLDSDAIQKIFGFRAYSRVRTASIELVKVEGEHPEYEEIRVKTDTHSRVYDRYTPTGEYIGTAGSRE